MPVGAPWLVNRRRRLHGDASRLADRIAHCKGSPRHSGHVGQGPRLNARLPCRDERSDLGRVAPITLSAALALSPLGRHVARGSPRALRHRALHPLFRETAVSQGRIRIPHPVMWDYPRGRLPPQDRPELDRAGSGCEPVRLWKEPACAPQMAPLVKGGSPTKICVSFRLSGNNRPAMPSSQADTKPPPHSLLGLRPGRGHAWA